MTREDDNIFTETLDCNINIFHILLSCLTKLWETSKLLSDFSRVLETLKLNIDYFCDFCGPSKETFSLFPPSVFAPKYSALMC